MTQLATRSTPNTKRVGRLAVFGLGSTAVGASGVAQTIRFSEPVIYNDTGRCTYVASADFDSDADSDVVVSSLTAQHIYFNDGVGGLSPMTEIPLEGDNFYLLVTDFDGDQHADVGWFSRHPSLGSQFSVWYNDGDGLSGTVVQTLLPDFFVNIEPAIGDFDADGFDDVAFVREERTISVLLNGRDRAFSLQDVFRYGLREYEVKALAAGDFDDDGDADVAATYQDIYTYRNKEVRGTDVLLLLNDGRAPFRLASSTPLDWNALDIVAADVAAGDLEGDGDLDVVVAGYPGNGPGTNEFILMRNQSGHALEIASVYRASDGRQNTTLADINTDGRLDLVFVVSNVNGVYVARNDGGFSLTGISPFYSGGGARSVAVTDLSGDGQIDLLHIGSGLSALVNTTRLRGPVLSVGPLRRGRQARFIVEHAAPGERVEFIYSLEGYGPSTGYRYLGGLSLDLASPTVLLSRTLADSNGRAVVRKQISPSAPPIPVTFQAAIRRGTAGQESVKTPFVTRLVQD